MAPLEIMRRIESATASGYPQFSTREMTRRQQAVYRLIDERELACVIVSGAGHVNSPLQYFSNWPSRVPCYLVFWPDRTCELLVRLWNHLPDARNLAVVTDIVFGGHAHGELLGKLAARLDARGGRGRRVGVMGRSDYWDLTHLQASVGCEIVSLAHEYTALRRIKSAEELDFIRVAAHFGDLAIAALHESIRPDMTELELQCVVHECYLGTRVEPNINFFLSTPMRAPDRCVPRQFLSNRRIQTGDVIVTEISAWYWGYTGQVLRTFVVGQEPDALYSNLYDVAAEVFAALLARCRAGVTVAELLAVADLIHRRDLTIWDDLIHGHGGGGYFSPVLRTSMTGGADADGATALDENSVIVIQPNVISRAVPGAGVQVGSSVLVGAGGGEVLQRAPHRILVCG